MTPDHKLIEKEGTEPDTWICNVDEFGYVGSVFKHFEYCPRCGRSVDIREVRV